MHVDTIRSIFKFDPYLTFIDPSRECPGISSGTPKLKMFITYLGIQKHFQTFVPRNWSRDLQAGPLLLLPYVFSRGSARGGQGVISAYFAKMTSKFGFLAAFGGHS